MGPMGPRGFGGVRGAVGTSGIVGGGTWGHGGGFVRGGFGGPFVHNGAVVHGAFAHGFRAAPVHFFRPYYAFHPHASLGFGIWAGYPFAYGYPYYYPYYDPFYYPNGYVSSYTYPAYDNTYPTTAESVQSGSAGSQPDQTNMGGMSFDITPATAQVFVDGTLVGTVGDFTPTTQPLGLLAGRHHVEVRATGYHTMTFDVDIVAGQVIPYQGTLERE